MYIPSYISDKKGLKQYVQELCQYWNIKRKSPEYYVLKNNAIATFHGGHSPTYNLHGGASYPTLVHSSRTNFLTALVADQIHDFLAKTDRSILIQQSGINSVERLVYVWKKVGIDLSYRHQGRRYDKYDQIVELARGREGGDRNNQRIALDIITQLKAQTDISPIQDFTALSILISQKLTEFRGDLGKISSLITTEASEQQKTPPVGNLSSDCSPFRSSSDLIVRTLLPEEFNCYKSMLVEHAKLQENPQDIKSINIVVDATRERDTTLTNTLIAESAPNELCRKYRRSRCHLDSVETKIEKILPNDFDKAKEDSLIPFQRNLANKFVHSIDHTCDFVLRECNKKGVSRPGRDMMNWNLVRLPNALQVLFNLSQFPLGILSDPLEQAADQDSLLSYLYHSVEGEDPKFTRIFWDSLREASKDELLDYQVVSKSGEPFWCNQIIEGGDIETRRAQLHGLVDLLPHLEGATEFHQEFKLADKSELAKIGDGCIFYREQVSILHKLQYLKNDLKTLLERIKRYFKAHCNYGWKEIFNEHREWMINIVASLEGKIPGPSFRLLRGFVEDLRLLGQDSYYTFMVEGEEDITTTGTFTQLATQWWFFLWFLHDRYNFKTNIFENLVVQRVVCKDLLIHKTNFSEEMVHVSCYLSNQAEFGPSVKNVGNFLEEIRYLFLDEFECTASINGLQRLDDWVTISRERGSEIYKIIIQGSEYELPQIAIIYLFMQGYIDKFDFTDSYTLTNGEEQGFEGTDEEFYDSLRDSESRLARYYFLAMMSKTLCDLSISSWCASENQSRRNPDTRNLFLTFDGIAACISSMLYGMKSFTLLQRDKALFIPNDNSLFGEQAFMETEGFKMHCLLEDR